MIEYILKDEKSSLHTMEISLKKIDGTFYRPKNISQSTGLELDGDGRIEESS